jgi:hypothetical protein
MKMRRKPMRGELLETYDGRGVTFIERAASDKNVVKVIFNDRTETFSINNLVLPIIDTKDYEKIADEKYKGA